MARELICRCKRRLSSGFDLEAEMRLPADAAQVTVLHGPSGSGKTTLLRILAGLERPDEGDIRFGEEVWFDSARGICLPPQARHASFVFQNYALFPHLTVEENVSFAAAPGSVARLLESFSLAALAHRKPAQLSSGQQQRTALARALAASPALLLLDEPLSALDAPTRAQTRAELRRQLRSAGVPSILVTHDRTEAMALGDWLAVIIEGRVRQTGAPPDVFRRPVDSAAAASLGVENMLPGVAREGAGGLLAVSAGPALLECVDTGERGPSWALIRAEDIAISKTPPASSARNRLRGTVSAVTPEGALARVELDCGFPLVAAITAQSATELGLAPGDVVTATVKAAAVHVIPRDAQP